MTSFVHSPKSYANAHRYNYSLCITSAGNATGVHARKDLGKQEGYYWFIVHLVSPYGTQILQVFHTVASARNSEFQPRCPLSPQMSSEALITILILKGVQTGALFSFSKLMCCGILKLVPRDSVGWHQESLVGVEEGSRVHMWQCVGKDEQRDPKWLSGCVCTHRRRGEDPSTILAWRTPASSMGVSGVSIFEWVNEQMCSRVKPTEVGKEDADFRAELWKRKAILLSSPRGNPSNMVVHIL